MLGACPASHQTAPPCKKHDGGALEEPASFFQYTPPCNVHTRVIFLHCQRSQRLEEPGVKTSTALSSVVFTVINYLMATQDFSKLVPETGAVLLDALLFRPSLSFSLEISTPESSASM